MFGRENQWGQQSPSKVIQQSRERALQVWDHRYQILKTRNIYIITLKKKKKTLTRKGRVVWLSGLPPVAFGATIFFLCESFVSLWSTRLSPGLQRLWNNLKQNVDILNLGFVFSQILIPRTNWMFSDKTYSLHIIFKYPLKRGTKLKSFP